jgi:DNA-binding NarL/FixJ family response regulator
MHNNTKTASALLWALGLAREHGGAAAALAAVGTDLPEVERFEGAPGEFEEVVGHPAGDASLREAVALGVLAGRFAHEGPRARRLQDPTSFVLDQDLVVQAADGQSIMRLPWFEEGLFVGRQLHDISEMPIAVRRLCIEHYSAALSGERGRFAFVSYGHAYSVDAVPVHGDDGRIATVLAIATPARSFAAAAAASERTAERLDRSAKSAERRAERYRLCGRIDIEVVESHAARKARDGAERARANASRLRARGTAAPAAPPSVTSRQAEILGLASHGLTSAEIAEQLGVSVTTVKTHFDNIYMRLGVSDKAAAVAAALRHGLID